MTKSIGLRHWIRELDCILSHRQLFPLEELEKRVRVQRVALQAFVASYSFAGAVAGTRLKAELTHRSSRPVFSLRLGGVLWCL